MTATQPDKRARPAPKIYSEDAEQAVLSAILLEPHATRAVRPLLRPDDFYIEKHARIYRAQLALVDCGTAIDPLTLSEELERHSELEVCGGKEYIGFLMDAVPTAVNVEYHAKIVLDTAKRRSLVERAKAASLAAVDPTVDPTTTARSLRDALDGFLAIEESGRFKFFTDLELSALPPQQPAIDGILYLDTLATIVAKWESFKTFIALEMAFCIATGESYYGRSVSQGAVVYLSAEGGRGVAQRVAALRAKYGYPAVDIPLVILPRAIDIAKSGEAAQALKAASHRLRDIGLAHMPIAAVFIDTVARNMSGDENKVEDMKMFIDGCDHLRHQTSACIVAVHHTGWGKDDEPRSRGSSALPAAVDTEIVLTRDGDRVTLKCTKQKDVWRFADLTLEAFPTAGSLVFRGIAPSSPRCSDNEVRALQEVQTGGGLRSNAWNKATGLSDGSYNNARRRLLALGYVRLAGDKYVATDAGRAALSARCKLGAEEVQA